MKKQILSMLLVCAMSTFLFACGNESTQPTEPTESTEQQVTEETPTTEIKDSTETEPAEEPTVEQETVENTETEESSTEQETAESTEIEPTATTEPTEEASAQYTYTDLSAIMYAQQTVNVRNQPSTDGEKVGSLSTNQEVSVSGQCNETSWYRIEYNGTTAYVSNNYLGDSKVEIAQSNSSNSDAGNSTSSNACPYTLWEPVDNGDSFSLYVVQPDSNHMDTLRLISDTLYARAKENSNDFSIQQTGWDYVGAYDEGEVYYLVWSIIYH